MYVSDGIRKFRLGKHLIGFVVSFLGRGGGAGVVLKSQLCKSCFSKDLSL